MRKVDIVEHVQKFLDKLQHKDRQQFDAIMEKIREIATTKNIDHYKHLKHDLKGCQRVHAGSYVLIFLHNLEEDTVRITTYAHHDNAYR